MQLTSVGCFCLGCLTWISDQNDLEVTGLVK